MKKFTAILVALLCAASLAATLTACTNKPTQEEVEQAIADGSVTVEDAVEKGWVTQEWAEEYQESLSVPTIDKVAYHAIGEFTTQTMSGEEFTRDDVADVTFFAFIDPASSEAENYYQEIVIRKSRRQEQRLWFATKGRKMQKCLPKRHSRSFFITIH